MKGRLRVLGGSGKDGSDGDKYFSYFYNYPRASLKTQLVKNPPAVQETPVQSLGWEDPLDKGKAIYTPVFWPGESHGLYNPWGGKETRLSDFFFHFKAEYYI